MSKLLRSLLAATLSVVLATALPANASSSTVSRSTNYQKSTNDLSRRIQGMDLPLRASSSDAYLQRKLRDYLGAGSHSTEKMLGRANRYFPVFEYYLAKHGMPTSLKYLAVAESMLVPRAVSGAQAAGLWQLMPATARGMGLRVDDVVDERLDLHRSTEAAVLMLRDLHRQFGDWHLALAAYNCGPGRVRRAIRQAGGYTHYPKVKPYLPLESQRYVAAYVAAAYTLNYYQDYGLTPADHLSEDSIAHVRVFEALNFRRLAEAASLDYAELRRLNPSFVRGYVPRSRKGYDVRVPFVARYATQTYVWGRPNLVEVDPDPMVGLAVAAAEDMPFEADFWLLGATGVVYESRPSYAYALLVEDWLVDRYQAFEALAML